MNAWMTVGVILALLFFLSLVRVGGAVDYSDQGLAVRLLMGPLRIVIFPRPPKERKRLKRDPPRPKEKRSPPSEPVRRDDALALLKEFLPLVAESAGKLTRKIRVNHLDLDLTVAAPDPAMAAMAYGGAHAALGMLVSLLENNFDVKERSIRTVVDFHRNSPTVSVRAALTLTVGQGTAFAFHLGIQFIRIWMRHRKNEKAKI